MWGQETLNPLPSDLPNNGWFVSLENIDWGDGTYGGGLVVWYAGGVVDSIPFSSYHPTMLAEIFLRDASQIVFECSGWELHSTKFEVYLDGVLVFTRTLELFKAGDSWDPRCNQTQVVFDYGTLTPPIVLYPPYGPAHGWTVTAAVGDSGWTHGGTEETIDIDTTWLPPVLTCPCSADLPAIGATGCEHVTLSGEAYLTATLTDRGEIDCYRCPDGSDADPPARWHAYDAAWDFKLPQIGGIAVTVAARNDGIKTIRKEAGARCSSTGDTEEPYILHGPEDFTLDHTQAEVFNGVHRVKATKTYAFNIDPGACGGIGGGDSEPADVVPCVEDHTSLCVYDAYVLQRWPVIPVCGADDTIGAVHLHRDVTGLDYAVISFDKHVDLLRFNYDGDEATEIIVPPDLGFTAIAGAQAGWHSEGHDVCVFIDSGTIWRTTNYGKGDTGIWSEPVTVTPGDALAFAIDPKGNAEYVAAYKTIGGDTGWFLYRMLDGEAGFSLIGLIVVSGTVLFAGLEVDSSSANRLIFVYNDAGTIYRLYSMDFGDHWN